MGYYDDTHGFYVEYSDGQAWVVHRTATIDTKVAQSSWNGSSNVVLDISSVHVFFFEFQCLGEGVVNVGVMLDGTPQVIHVFHTTVQYTPLPTRYEAESGGGAASMQNFASSVVVEGGENRGISTSVNSGVQVRRVLKLAANPIFSLRLIPGSRANVRVASLNILRQGRHSGLWEVFVVRDSMGELTDSNFQQKTAHVECDFEATSLTSSASVIASGYETGDGTSSFTIQELDAVLTNNISGVSDMLVVTYTPFGARNDIYVSASWREYL
jgi:hypothetical protein